MSSLCGVKARKKHGGNRYTLKRANRMKRNEGKGKTFLNSILTPDQYKAIKQQKKNAKKRN